MHELHDPDSPVVEQSYARKIAFKGIGTFKAENGARRTLLLEGDDVGRRERDHRFHFAQRLVEVGLSDAEKLTWLRLSNLSLETRFGIAGNERPISGKRKYRSIHAGFLHVG